MIGCNCPIFMFRAFWNMNNSTYFIHDQWAIGIRLKCRLVYSIDVSYLQDILIVPQDFLFGISRFLFCLMHQNMNTEDPRVASDERIL